MFDQNTWNTGLQLGHAVESQMRAGDAKGICGRFNTSMAQMVSQDQVAGIIQDMSSQAPMGDRLGESVRTDPDNELIYMSEYAWGKNVETLTVVFDGNQQITGMTIKGQEPLPPDPHAGYVTKGTYLLPFTGTWFVFWGGNTDVDNDHVVAADQRHAYDIVMVKNGSTHQGSADDNTHYYDFGQKILAPINATVVEAVDGIADNTPGVMNTNAPAGNHVILDCGNGEYLLMAHFKDHSLKVHAGDKVTAGEPIAQCGNSGNTSEPHLHIHLQDGPTLFQAEGLPLEFSNFTADGTPVSKAEVVQGQYIKPQ